MAFINCSRCHGTFDEAGSILVEHRNELMLLCGTCKRELGYTSRDDVSRSGDEDEEYARWDSWEELGPSPCRKDGVHANTSTPLISGEKPVIM